MRKHHAKNSSEANYQNQYPRKSLQQNNQNQKKAFPENFP